MRSRRRRNSSTRFLKAFFCLESLISFMLIDVLMISYIKTICLILLLIFIALSAPTAVVAGATTLYQSVEQALNTNPQLKALADNRQALQYDLEQSRGGYLPNVDLSLGYGSEQYSDDVTRRAGADPSDSDWISRGDATLRLTQQVYDGGETGSQVSIRKALLDSGNYQLQATAQTISLDAVTAHLNVFWQRELVALAEKNLKIHRDMYQSIAEREQAGAGSIADVTQVQARLARAESTLYLSQAELSQANANYTRVIGTPPGELAYAGGPETLPQTLEEALQGTEQGNPELLALGGKIVEADSRLSLARSKYKPKIDLELNSGYNDGVEGNPSWRKSNTAMLVLHWNLFSGGQDKAGTNAALSRKYQSRSIRAAKLAELKEATSTVWENYLALQRQKAAFRDAVDYSRKTFDAYLIQFSVSKRSLLDVLIVQNDYFQSAVQLFTVNKNETIAAYRILALGGELEIPRISGVQEYPEELRRLTQALVLPSADQSNHTELQAHPPSPTESLPRVSAVTEDSLAPTTEPETTSPDDVAQLYSMEIGPCITKRKLKQANEILRSRGFDARQISGTGAVRFTRLLEGVYPPHEAYKRLEELKKTVSAFVLPVDKQLAIYVGSFHDSDRVIRHTELLEQKKIKVTPIAVEIEMEGTILVVQQIDRKTAEIIAEQMSKLGLTAKII